MQDHASKPEEAQAFACNAECALRYIPALLMNLGAETGLRMMFAQVLQAMLDAGYEDGFRDGLAQSARDTSNRNTEYRA